MNKKYTLLPLLTATLVACGGGGTPSPENEKPMVSLKRADGSVITTTTYLGAGDRIIVSSSDADGNITKVQWKIDDKAGEFSGTDVKSRLELPLTGLSNGTHTAEVTVTDNAGATATASTTFNVDAVAPAISKITLNGTQVASGSTTNLTIGDAASLTVTATDSRGTEAAAASPATIRIMEGTSVRATGTDSVTADLSKAADGKDRAAGPVTFTIIAKDSAGNSTASTATLNFIAAGEVDNTKPTFSWLSPSADYVPGNSTVNVRATATRSGSEVKEAIVYTATCGTVVNGNWNTAGCEDGSKQVVTATVTIGGKAYSDTKTVTVDASAPTVQITSPNTGTEVTVNPVKVNLTATDAVSGVATVVLEASRDGGAFEQVGVLTTASGEITWAPSNGSYTLRATATDRTGNRNTTTVTGINVKLTSSDKTAPTVNGLEILNKSASGVERGTVTAQVTATDADSGVAKVELFDGGTSLGVQTAGVGGKYTFTLDTTKLSDGAHTLRAVATDNVGLSSQTSLTIQTDNTAPVLTWLSPTDGSMVGGTVNLNATTNEGTVEYTVDGEKVTGTSYTFKADGAHTITASATDKAGNTTTSTIKVTSDATAPTAQITSPAQGATITSNPVTVSVNGSDNLSGVKSLEVFANGTSIGTVNGESGTVTWAPQSGDYALTVIATDKAGNKGAASAPVNVTVKLATADTTAPTFVGAATVQPAPTASFSRGVITLDGFVKDPESGISQVALFNGGVRLNATPSLSIQPDGSTRYALTLDSKTLADGTYTLTIQATNGVGLVSNQDVSVKIDNTAPGLNWNAPTTVGSAGTITLNATTETGATITYAASCGTITGTTWTYGDCQDGTAATLTATATDAAGNTTTQTRTITVDRTAPTVQITSPTQGQKVTQNPITITVSGTDNIAVERIDVLSGTTRIGTVTGAQGSVTWAAPNGNQTLTARAYDRAGNVTETQISFTVALTTSDTTAPTGAVTTPASDLRGQTTVSVTASDTDSGVATVSLYVDGLLSSTQTTGIAGAYTFPVDTTKLSEGQHAITAVITDNAGNTFATPSVTARVNNAAPTVTITNPQNGALLGGASDAAVKAIASDPTPGDTITLEYSVDSGAFSTSAPTLPKQDGTHTVTVRAVDAAGNSSTATTTYTYDGTAPTVQITSPTQGQLLTSAPVTISVIGQDGGTGLASINVYANDGTSPDELIGTLSGNGSVTWYPRKTDGTPYTIRAVATDRAGNPSTDTTSPGATVTGVRVKTASTITVTGGPTFTLPNADPKGGLHTANGRTYVRGPLVVNATATTDATMTQADLQADGQTLQTTTTTPANPTFNFDFDALNEGLRDVAVRFTDSLGTVAATKTTVFVDKTAPIITWNTPLSGSLTNAPVTLNATATDSASGTNGTVTFTENGQPVTNPVSADGQHTVTATAVDNVGNVGTRNITFTIDATAPEVIPALPDSPTNPQEFTTAPVTLTATATDTITSVSSIEVLVGLKGTPTNPTQLVTLGRQNGSSYSAVFTPSVAGDYEVQYIARDAAGNSSTVNRVFRYTVSTPPSEKAPDPKIFVANSQSYSGNVSVQVAGNFDSVSQVDRMILQIKASNGVVDNSTYVTNQSNATFSVDTTKFANGNATLELIAYTKSGLRGTSTPPVTLNISNVLSPKMAVASPSDGVTVTTPSVPVKVTITNSGTLAPINVGSVKISLYDYRGQLVAIKTENSIDPVKCVYSNNGMDATCDTSFDIAGLPADKYIIRAQATANLQGGSANALIEASSSFTSNTVSVNPPAATISFPTAVTLNQTDTNGNRIRVPARIDSGSGFFATVSDNTSIQYVEARIVGPYAEGNIETDGTRQCQASGSIVSDENEINVLLLNVPGAGVTAYQPQDVFVPKLDIDGSTYVPDSKPGQRYDMRVTTADAEGNRNIQCVPVKVERGLTRPSYGVSNSTTPSSPSNTPGELTYTSGTWTLDSIPANSRVVAILYSNGKQVGTEFFAKTNGNPLKVSQTFSDVGTYEVKWLIEDMSDIAPTQLNSTGVVTTQAGGYINVARNPK